MNRNSIIKSYKSHYNLSMGRMFDLANCPIELSAKGSYVFDLDGNKYLDLCSGYGVHSLGHSNEKIKSAAIEQLLKYPVLHSCFQNEIVAQFLKCLISILPIGLNQVYLANSGSEAMEIALRTVLINAKGKQKIIAVTNGYHGKSLGALSILGQSALRVEFEPLLSNIEFISFGDIKKAKQMITKDTLAFIVEPILGGGYLEVPPDGYLKEIRNICNNTNTLLIVDEVQTGFGRTGKMFGFEWDAIVPDIVIASKGISGGVAPVAVTIVHEKLTLKPLKTGSQKIHFDSTSMTSIYNCAVSLASIKYIIENDLVKEVKNKGAYFKDKLQALIVKFPDLVIGIQGKGLMLGLKVKNNIIEYVLWLQLLDRGLIGGLSTNLTTKNPVLRCFPNLTISYPEIDEACSIIEDALKSIHKKPKWFLNVNNYLFKFQFYLPYLFLKTGKKLLIS